MTISSAFRRAALVITLALPALGAAAMPHELIDESAAHGPARPDRSSSCDAAGTAPSPAGADPLLQPSRFGLMVFTSPGDTPARRC